MAGTSLMNDKSYKYEDLIKKYQNCVAPTLKVAIGGKEIPSDKVMITELRVDLSCGMEASGCAFEVAGLHDLKQRELNQDAMKKYFQLGKPITVELGYIKTTQVFAGYISGLSASFGDDITLLTVECTDVKGLLMNNQYTQQLKAQSYSAAVNEVLKMNAYSKFYSSIKADTTTKLKKRVEIVNESHYDFIKRLALRQGYEFFVLQGIVYFRKPMPFKTEQMNFEWAKNVLGFQKRVSLEGQISELELRGYKPNEPLIWTAKIKSKIEKELGSDGKNALKGLTRVMVDLSTESEAQIKERAEAMMLEANRKFALVNIESIGFPELVPGRMVKVSKFGKDYDGKYYVTKVSHLFSKSYYKTYIEARLAI